jgi:uncharacterized membrane protein
VSPSSAASTSQGGPRRSRPTTTPRPSAAYPFILLNLAFSTQAAYAAPLILLAQNRQAERDRREYELDRKLTAEMRAETDFLARELAAARLALGRIEATLSRAEQRPEEANASS